MQKLSGFTLMELMVVIAIVSVLTAIAIPNVISWRFNAQINSAARDLYASLQEAKSIAVREHLHCTVIFNENSNELTLYLQDPAGFNKPEDIDESDETTYRRKLKTVSFTRYGNVQLENNDFPVAGSYFAISFGPNGFPYREKGVLSDGSMTLRGVSDKRIVLTMAGNISIKDL